MGYLTKLPTSPVSQLYQSTATSLLALSRSPLPASCFSKSLFGWTHFGQPIKCLAYKWIVKRGRGVFLWRCLGNFELKMVSWPLRVWLAYLVFLTQPPPSPTLKCCSLLLRIFTSVSEFPLICRGNAAPTPCTWPKIRPKSSENCRLRGVFVVLWVGREAVTSLNQCLMQK